MQIGNLVRVFDGERIQKWETNNDFNCCIFFEDLERLKQFGTIDYIELRGERLQVSLSKKRYPELK